MTGRELVAETLIGIAAEVRSVEVAGLLGAAAWSLVADDPDDLTAAELTGIRWATVLAVDLGPGFAPSILATLATPGDPTSPAAPAWTEAADLLERWALAADRERLRHSLVVHRLAAEPAAT